MNNILNIIMNMMMNGNNPEAIMNQLANKVPEVKSLLTQVKNSGMSPEQYARQYAKQNGLDINECINNMRKIGFKF